MATRTVECPVTGCGLNDAPTLDEPGRRREFFAELWNSGGFAEHVAHIRAYAAGLPVGPCPSWCLLPDGHPWEWEIGDSFSRVHEHDCDGVVVSQEEYNDDSEPRAVVAFVPGRDDIVTTDTAEMRRLGAGLLNAADRLDEITAATP